MKKHILLTASICFVLASAAQSKDESLKKKAAEGNTMAAVKDTGWLLGGVFSSNFSSTTFSNWASGGSSNLALVCNASLFAIYKSENGKGIWENYLDVAYGVMRSGKPKIEDPSDSSRKINNPFVKNKDKLVFQSKYGRLIPNKLNYTALASINTQIFPGWTPEDALRKNGHVSNFLAQGFGYVSLGIDYKPKPFLSIYASPLTAKYTIVREQRLANLGLYGVEGATYDTLGNRLKQGQTFRTELGWYLNISFNKDILKNVTYQSRLELFQNYQTVILKQTDLNWQNTINIKVNKYLTVVLINQIIWDYDIDTRTEEDGLQRNWQLKNFFGVGFSAKFGDKL